MMMVEKHMRLLPSLHWKKKVTGGILLTTIMFCFLFISTHLCAQSGKLGGVVNRINEQSVVISDMQFYFADNASFKDNNGSLLSYTSIKENDQVFGLLDDKGKIVELVITKQSQEPRDEDKDIDTKRESDDIRLNQDGVWTN